MKILYDGWPLAASPASPAALHLLALLSILPGEVQAEVAVPEPVAVPLPKNIHPDLLKREMSEWGRLRWLQRDLPGFGRASEADLLHLTSAGGPISARMPVVISPAGVETQMGHGFTARLLRSFQQGSLAAARRILWPEDLPLPAHLRTFRYVRLPPLVHPAFYSPPRPSPLAEELPDAFILYPHTGDTLALETLLSAWGWAAPAIGENYPLVVMGLNREASQGLREAAEGQNLLPSLQILPPLAAQDIPSLYQACSAVFHLGRPAAWGDGLRPALAAGKPLAAEENGWSSQIVGPAAYLAPAGDGRALSAALITILVEESVASPLIEAGRQRVEAWQPETFSTRLMEAYQAALE